ncbi:heat shock protein DnaJ, partial [Lichtheimia hyalospora FSU 10163]
MKDYYSILEINKTSDSNKIKETYKKLILKWHPDKNHKYYDTNSIFRDIKEAYDILNNNEKRVIYDI